MYFKERQQLRKFKWKIHQKRNAKLMRKFGGYNSFKWRTFVDRIRAKILKKIRIAQMRQKTNVSNG